MKKLQQGNSFILDTSIGINNGLYLSPTTKKGVTQSFSQKQDLCDQNLQCNLFLFLSIVHGNNNLNRIFIQRCLNKDRFLGLFDTNQYSMLLTKVLQIINQYFTETQQINIDKQNINKLYSTPEQKRFNNNNYQNRSENSEKFQTMIKKIITNDLDPLKSLIQKGQYQYNNKSSQQLQQKLIKTNILKDQLKDKITKLAMQNSYITQYKLMKTENTEYYHNPKILKESQSQTIITSDNKPNRISFGQQNLLNHNNSDEIIEFDKQYTNQKNNIIETSPTFIQYEDNAIQTNDQLNISQVSNQSHKNQHKQHLSPKEKLNKAFEGTFGKHIKKKKSSSISESVSPSRNSRNNYDTLSIDQVQRKRKISVTNNINRNYNILTNEQIE